MPVEALVVLRPPPSRVKDGDPARHVLVSHEELDINKQSDCRTGFLPGNKAS